MEARAVAKSFHICNINNTKTTESPCTGVCGSTFNTMESASGMGLELALVPPLGLMDAHFGGSGCHVIGTTEAKEEGEKREGKGENQRNTKCAERAREQTSNASSGREEASTGGTV
jgi:hypothetical protein